MSLLLGRAGVEVEVVDDGRKVLGTACAKDFDLILIEMDIPEISGYDVVHELRARGLKRTIIGMTSYMGETIKQRCIEVGCDGYLAKPIVRRQLYEVIGHYLPRQEELTETQPEGPTDNEDWIISEFSDVPELTGVIEDLTKKLADMAEQMLEAADKNDSILLAQLAHTLAGVGADGGFGILAEKASQIEQLALEGEMQNAGKLVDEFCKLCDRIRIKS